MSRGMLLLVLTLVAVTLVFQTIPVDAKKASGTYNLQYGSATNVCGNSICDTPMSMDERIAQFLKDGYINLESTTNAFSFGGKLGESIDVTMDKEFYKIGERPKIFANVGEPNIDVLFTVTDSNGDKVFSKEKLSKNRGNVNQNIAPRFLDNPGVYAVKVSYNDEQVSYNDEQVTGTTTFSYGEIFVSHISTDKESYQLGDVIHYSGSTGEREDIDIEIHQPNGRMILDIDSETNSAGIFEGEIDTDDWDLVGEYDIRLRDIGIGIVANALVLIEEPLNDDDDLDGLDNLIDNCLDISNPAQLDSDSDGIGDACEPDTDVDGVIDDVDNCPSISNFDQLDTDTDGVGDVCEPFADISVTAETNLEFIPPPSNYGAWASIEYGPIPEGQEFSVIFEITNSGPDSAELLEINVYDNYGQIDQTVVSDGDYVGVGKYDEKIWSIPSLAPNESATLTMTGIVSGIDTSFDVIFDVISSATNDPDSTPGNPNYERAPRSEDDFMHLEIHVSPSDEDLDGVPDKIDNCVSNSNPEQLDVDEDGIGNLCDDDSDNDSILDVDDNCQNSSNIDQLDIDSDGVGFVCDAKIIIDSNITLDNIYLKEDQELHVNPNSILVLQKDTSIFLGDVINEGTISAECSSGLGYDSCSNLYVGYDPISFEQSSIQPVIHNYGTLNVNSNFQLVFGAIENHGSLKISRIFGDDYNTGHGTPDFFDTLITNYPDASISFNDVSDPLHIADKTSIIFEYPVHNLPGGPQIVAFIPSDYLSNFPRVDSSCNLAHGTDKDQMYVVFDRPTNEPRDGASDLFDFSKNPELVTSGEWYDSRTYVLNYGGKIDGTDLIPFDITGMQLSINPNKIYDASGIYMALGSTPPLVGDFCNIEKPSSQFPEPLGNDNFSESALIENNVSQSTVLFTEPVVNYGVISNNGKLEVSSTLENFGQIFNNDLLSTFQIDNKQHALIENSATWTSNSDITNSGLIDSGDGTMTFVDSEILKSRVVHPSPTIIHSFTGSEGSESWNNPNNWSTGMVPGVSDVAIIPQGKTVHVDVTGVPFNHSNIPEIDMVNLATQIHVDGGTLIFDDLCTSEICLTHYVNIFSDPKSEYFASGVINEGTVINNGNLITPLENHGSFTNNNYLRLYSTSYSHSTTNDVITLPFNTNNFENNAIVILGENDNNFRWNERMINAGIITNNDVIDNGGNFSNTCDGSIDGNSIIGNLIDVICPSDDGTDTDHDGLSDIQEEHTYKTNYYKTDTDDDGISDYDELFATFTDPLNSDSDYDSILDSDEFSGDTDSDGLSDLDELTIYHTDIDISDTDSDGLSDSDELLSYYKKLLHGSVHADISADPLNPDTDGDTILDGVEVIAGYNPVIKDDYYSMNELDYDGDGISDYHEHFTYYTDLLNPDTDGDGLSDGFEKDYLCVNANYCSVDPLNPDTDGDGVSDGDEYLMTLDTDDDHLTDYDEINIHGTDPNNHDSDGDCLDCIVLSHGVIGTSTDYYELRDHGTDPNNPDTDDDGLTDYDELKVHVTDPNNHDTDGDGLLDGQEVNDYLSNPLDSDTDNDGIDDNVEIILGYDLLVKTDLLDLNFIDDYDGDGIIDRYELRDGSDPLNPPSDDVEIIEEIPDDGPVITESTDTDGDGISDLDEINIYGLDETNSDTDSDGLSDYDELFIFGTSAILPDTDGNSIDDFTQVTTSDPDGDNLSDYDELIIHATDPNDPDSDDDQLYDWVEVNTTLSNPNSSDSDSDGLSDYYEYLSSDYDLTNPDTDGDGINDYDEYLMSLDSDDDLLSDYDEINIHGTDPNNWDTAGDTVGDYETVLLNTDSDSDGLNDWLEQFQSFTDPTNPDTDGDGINDYEDYLMGLDSDNDNLSDYDEINIHGTDPNNWDTDGNGNSDHQDVQQNTDSDSDGLNDWLEQFQSFTDPTNPDSDGDGINDYDEYLMGLDSDNDNLSDYDEINIHGTDPNNWDTDGDDFGDNEEIFANSDPLDSDNTPYS